MLHDAGSKSKEGKVNAKRMSDGSVETVAVSDLANYITEKKKG